MRLPVLAAAAATSLAVAVAPVAAAPPPPVVQLELTGSYASGVFGKSASEITSFDPSTDRLFVVNAASGTVDVLDVSNPKAPTKLGALEPVGQPAADGSTIATGAVVNSVDVSNGVVAVAVAAADATKTDRGWVAFFDTATSAFRSAVRVGSLPDMVVYAPDGATLLVANEAEPAADFSSDPEGSVSLVDVTGPLTQASVRTATFTSYDEGSRTLRPGVRVFGPDVAVPAGQPTAGRIARNLEPEYVAVDKQSRTAYVSLQEANAVALLDLATGTFTDVVPLGEKSWSLPGNVLDPSDQDSRSELRNAPLFGVYQPDALATYEQKGRTYVVTANEGDAREWGSYNEAIRVGNAGYVLCDNFTAAEKTALKSNASLGRLNATKGSGLNAAGTCYERIVAFGGRSFSILDATGKQVFDSAGLLEQKVLELITAGELPANAFNANHDTNPSVDTRSDDKGPEPEGVAIGKADGRTYAFLGLERIGGVMVYDISNPRAPKYIDYVNNRDFSVAYSSNGAGAGPARDLGAEGVEFISAADSPTGRPVVAVANEVSGTTSLFTLTGLGPR